MNIKTFAQLTRAHTAPLEIVPAVYGAILAIGHVNIQVLLWAYFGLLYHLSGYGHNSVEDYRRGYDEDDPNKQHHPMNNSTAFGRWGMTITVYILIAVTFIYAVILVYPSIIAFSLGLGMAGAGMAYNMYGKRTESKFLLIATAHSLVFVLPYISLGGEINEVFGLSWALIFLWVVFQIAISGEMKDMETDESNFVKEMGASFNESVTGERILLIPTKVRNVASIINISLYISAVIIITKLGEHELILFSIVTLVMAARALITKDLLKSGHYNREDKIRQMSSIEVTSMIYLLVALSPVAGYAVSAIILALSFVWVVIFNQIEWGTYLSPKV